MANKANSAGKLAEDQVDISLRTYRSFSMAAGVKTFPEVTYVKPVGGRGSFEGRYTGQGAPDRAVAIRHLGGRLCWLEIKTWQAKDRHTLGQRLHQFFHMKSAIEDGGALGFYLVKWRWDQAEEWRLYPVHSLRVDEMRMVFEREVGWLVAADQGWPDWLPVALRGARAGCGEASETGAE